MDILINTMDREAADGAVIVVHWTTVQTTDGYTATQYGTESFTPDPQSPTYIPYDELTEAEVVGWLTDRWGPDGVAAKQAALDQNIEMQKNPPVLAGVPWST